MDAGIFKAILDKLCEEIAAYRRRQVTVFREALIVLAVITYGVGKLYPQDETLSLNVGLAFLRFLAAVASGFVTYAAVRMIKSYRDRIYHIRDIREKFAQGVLESSSEDTTLFFPTPHAATELGEADFSMGSAKPTSDIYNMTLITMGVLAVIVNLILAFYRPVAM